MSVIGLNLLSAKKIREGGFEKFFSDFRKHREEVENPESQDEEKKEKSSMGGNICCGIFLFLFLAFLVQSKLNEEFWRLYKTSGTEIEVKIK